MLRLFRSVAVRGAATAAALVGAPAAPASCMQTGEPSRGPPTPLASSPAPPASAGPAASAGPSAPAYADDDSEDDEWFAVLSKANQLLGGRGVNVSDLVFTLHGRNMVDSMLLVDVADKGRYVACNTYAVDKDSNLFRWLEANPAQAQQRLYIRAKLGWPRACVDVDVPTHLKVALSIDGPWPDGPDVKGALDLFIKTGELPAGCTLASVILGNSNIARFIGATDPTETNMRIFVSDEALADDRLRPIARANHLKLARLLLTGGDGHPLLRDGARAVCAALAAERTAAKRATLSPATKQWIDDVERSEEGLVVRLNTTARGTNTFESVYWHTTQRTWNALLPTPENRWRTVTVESELAGALAVARHRLASGRGALPAE